MTEAPPEYVDTPAGLLAADGTHYHTTEPLLREYAGPVVEAVGLAALLRRAGAWLRSPQTVAVLALPGLLFVLPWWGALGVAVLVYALWAAVAPGLVSSRLAPAAFVAESAALQGLVTIIALSVLANTDQFPAVWAGVLGFVALRLGLVGAALRPVVDVIRQSLYPLPAPDQTLRSLIVREALRRGVALAGMDEIESRVRGFWRKGGEGKGDGAGEGNEARASPEN